MTAAPVEETITTLDLTTRDQEAEPCDNQGCTRTAEYVAIIIPGCTHIPRRIPLCELCKNALASHDDDPMIEFRCRRCDAIVKVKNIWKIR